jgi:hypothetical protein
LLLEASAGFETIKAAPPDSIVAAAYVTSSLAFILAILLVMIKGVFSGLEKAESDTMLPPHVKEIYDIIKKARE